MERNNRRGKKSTYKHGKARNHKQAGRMHSALTPEALFTSPKQKTAEFAVFYNIAFFRIAGLLNHLLGNSYEENKNKLEGVFTDWLKVAGTQADQLPEVAYSRFRNYLWKGYLLEKNSSGYELTESDRQLVREMLKLLYNVRNFHSHAWHDNMALACSPVLSAFIEDMHKLAASAQSEGMANETSLYIDQHKDSRYSGNVRCSFFYKHSDFAHILTPDGRAFLLSFFVTRGEMARFLQQRQGSKRNDKPEFMIKHKVYRHFTHRDGASRNFYGFEEPVLKTLSDGERKEVLAMRQAFKVISYLNDVPRQSNDPKLFPLLKADGTEVDTIQELIDHCLSNELFSELVMIPVTRERTIKKSHKDKRGNKREKETVELEHAAEIYGGRWDGWKFQMGQQTLHKALLDSLRNGDNGEHLYTMLDTFVKERNELLDQVKRPENIVVEPERFTLNAGLDEYYRYRLRSGDKLRKRMGVWLANFGKPYGRNHTSSIKNFKQSIQDESIEVGYHDLWHGMERKPRRTDRFTEFAVQYLIDMGITPDWEWMHERFEGEMETKTEQHYGEERTVEKNVLKRRKDFSSVALEGQRLSMSHDQQVVVRLKAKPEQLYLLGHRALKNLLAAHVQGKDINRFLPLVAEDLEAFTTGKKKVEQLNVLCQHHIRPGMLRALGQSSAKDGDEARMKRAISRIDDTIIAQLAPFANAELDTHGQFANSVGMSRSDKNRQVMRCYTYFDWKYDEKSEFKFLRQDEYQRMSVFHYSLEHTYNNGNNRFEQDRRFGFLLKDIVSHMPNEVKELVRQSRHLDELLKKTAKATITLLQQWKREWKSCDPVIRKIRLSRIGIQGEPLPLEENRHVPFDIHPALVERALFVAEELRGQSLAMTVRKNLVLRDGLVESHYAHEVLVRLLKKEQDGAALRGKAKKAVGKMEELYAEDILLWAAAKEYLKAMNPAMRDLVENRLMRKTGNSLSVAELRDVDIPMEVDVEEHGKVVVALKLHQLDDFLLVESKPQIAKAVWHVLAHHESNDARKTVGIVAGDKDGKLSVPYEEVFRQIQRVYNDSIHWARPLLAWEQKLIAEMSVEEKAQLGAAKQAEGKWAYVSFREVLAHANLEEGLARTVRDTRNAAFHAELPSTWTYGQREQDKTFCELIVYEKREKKDYESGEQDRN